MRQLALRSLVIFGTVVAVLTELLSPFHLLRRGTLAAAWVLAIACGARWLVRRRPMLPWPAIRPVETAIAAAIVILVVPVGMAAVLSPPNSADAMAYHLPRVIYWAQAGSVAFFPTPYFNQIALQPVAEYLMLHTYLLTGGDHWVNLVAFLGFLGSIVGVSAIAGAMGLGTKAQAFAALFCATLPNAILQASGAKNDSLLALWLVAVVYFAVRRDPVFLDLSVGLALGTKATAYLVAPPLLVAVLLSGELPPRSWWRRSAAVATACVLLINGPQYLRNIQLSGSPLGPDSAQGDGFFRWRNDHPGWRSTASNVLRNLSEQLGSRSSGWNQAVFHAVLKAHVMLGLDPQDPETTWPWARYEAPVNANHEANANNRWHLLLLVVAALLVMARRKWRWSAYAAALLAAFLVFCFYLRWQPYLARLELPLFVLGAPLAATLFDWPMPRSRAWRGVAAVSAVLICAFLVDTARRPAVDNWTRPLKGPRSLFATSRDDNYFSDMGQWDNQASYREAVDRTARSGCEWVGIDINRNQLEYPFQALLREREGSVRYVHVGVENASARYATPGLPSPCAVFCPDCAGIPKEIDRYRPIGPPIVMGRFLLFLKP